MAYESVFERYGGFFQPGELTVDDLERAGTFLGSQSPADMGEWSDARTEVYELNGRRFRMVVDRPVNGDDSRAVVVGGEFGNGIAPGAIARARVVRGMVTPEATLVYQPNGTLNEPDNMNFSRDEREQLREGDQSPMLGRLAVALGSVDNPDNLTFYGPSQGGVVSLGYAAHPDTPPAAVAVVETPDVLERSRFELAKDFAGSGAQLKDIIRENYSDPNIPLAKATIDALSIVGLAQFAAGLLRRDNLALSGILRGDTAKRHIEAILERGGSVVQAYGTVNNVSPLAANERLARVFNGNPRYRSVRFEGSDHSMTNNYAVSGALARVARRLM